MPSTYTDSGIEIIGDGEQTGAWGDTTNTNLRIIDRMTSQVGSISLSGTTHTISLADGTLSDAHYAVLVFGGAPSATNTVTISPSDAQRIFIVKNSSGESVVITQGSGTDVTLVDGVSAIVYCDGGGAAANVVDLTASLPVLTIAGVTASVAELNLLEGVTATTAELNLLDGVTATTAELNYVDVTALGTSEASKAVTADADGDVIFSEEVKAKSYNETFVTVTSTTGAATINCEAGNVFGITLTENTTFTFSNPPTTGTSYGFTLKLVQDSTARTVTWPASVDWAGGTAPTISTGSGEVDVLVFFTHDGGTTWYGFVSGQVLS